ncbi:MAG: alpha/beta fold hydrolase [Alphaproteobacteria bacterium]|nr:alpha/beta fold hydrolase [Alphaproteobacteria bacterium]
MTVPPTRYARNGDVHIAYSTSGDGPIDLVWCAGFVTHLEYAYEYPRLAHLIRRLGGFTRLVRFDKRGVGLSDRRNVVASFETHMDDLRAVMDAAGVERAAIMGVSEGGPTALLFAATYPERVSALVLVNSYACQMRDEDQPWGFAASDVELWRQHMVDNWGRAIGLSQWAPSVKNDAVYKAWWEQYLKLGASPGAVADMTALYPHIDVRNVLPVIQAPTLVIHAAGDRAVPIQSGRALASAIPNARLVELDSVDHAPWLGDLERVVEEIEVFLTGQPSAPALDRVLATVLYTDLVDSTAQAAKAGDARWGQLMSEHETIARREIERASGRTIKFLGDGVLATFDGPVRAIRCAQAMRAAMATLGVEMRAGLHTGEISLAAADVGGIAVNIAARIVERAGPGDVLTSSTVRDLVIGSGVGFDDRGVHELKGVPGTWTLCAARA